MRAGLEPLSASPQPLAECELRSRELERRRRDLVPTDRLFELILEAACCEQAVTAMRRGKRPASLGPMGFGIKRTQEQVRIIEASGADVRFDEVRPPGRD